jgi:parvulin-like peptidyl-prolyl isomerase
MRRITLWPLVLILALAPFGPAALAAEKAEEPEAKKAEAKAEEEAEEAAEGAETDVVAKVNEETITRGELIEERRQIALSNPRSPIPNNEVILDRLINRILLQRHIEKEGLAPSGGEVQKAIQRFDAQLRRRGSTYEEFLDKSGLTAESHAARIRYQISLRKLVQQIADEVTDEQIRAEFDAHPEYYDGSRIRISQIFVDTSNISHDPQKVEEAKQKIDKCYADVQGGKEFKHVASDHSEGPAAARGGDRGWFERKASEADEELLSAAWDLKVGEYTEPIRGQRGWHVLKVTDREPARLTFFGAKPRVKKALTRERVDQLIEELKAKAKIEKML